MSVLTHEDRTGPSVESVTAMFERARQAETNQRQMAKVSNINKSFLPEVKQNFREDQLADGHGKRLAKQLRADLMEKHYFDDKRTSTDGARETRDSREEVKNAMLGRWRDNGWWQLVAHADKSLLHDMERTNSKKDITIENILN